MLNLAKTKARDVMVTDVVQLHALTPVARAIETFEEYAISGAPVVDEAGSLVGVLSATDLIKRDQSHEEGYEPERSTYYSFDPLDEWEAGFSGGEGYSPELLGRELVSDWMTPRVICVGPDSSLAEVCALMVQERIHRVFVVDGDRLVGVVATFDVVNYLANDHSGKKRQKPGKAGASAAKTGEQAKR